MPSHALTSRIRSRIRAEQSGFTLIEVLVSALVVVIVSLGVLKSIDAANARSGYQKQKSVAAAMAQQDQERLRAFRAQELNNMTEIRCVWVRSSGSVKDPECNDTGTAGVKYRVISRTDWVSDSSGTRACGTGARADYIRISSTVVWSDTVNGSPGDEETGSMRRVSLASIVAPRVGSFDGEGSLSIEVRGGTGVGKANMPVTVTGPKGLSGTTDANGCLFFGYLPTGNYTVNVSQPGHVDANGVATIARQFGVQEGSVTSAVVEYDLAGTMNVRFRAKRGTAAEQDSVHDYVTIAHSSLSSPSWKVPATTPAIANGTFRNTFAIPNLFPFSSAYTVYAGNCSGANPAIYGQTVAPGARFIAVPAGGSTSTGTTSYVREPGLQVRRDSTNLADNSRVTLTWEPNLLPARGGAPTYCTGTDVYRTDSGGWVKQQLSSASVWTNDPGVPYGTYTVCAEWDPDGAGAQPIKRLVKTGVEVGLPDGVTVSIPTAGAPNGTCP